MNSIWPLVTSSDALVTSSGALIAAFIGTNIDDLAILLLLFATAKPNQRSAIFWGQTLGLLAISALALAMATGLSGVPTHWLRFLGFVPLLLGLKEGYSYVKNLASERVDPAIDTRSRHWWQVSAIVLAGSGDNLAVYVPLMVTLSPFAKAFSVVLFTVLSVLWCALGLYLSRHPLAQRVITPYSEAITSAVLILLGLGILTQVLF